MSSKRGRSDDVVAIADTLEARYRPLFAEHGGGFSVWGNAHQIGAEVLFGGSSGPMLSTSVPIDQRRGWRQRWSPVRPQDEAVRLLCAEIDDWLATKAWVGLSSVGRVKASGDGGAPDDPN